MSLEPNPPPTASLVHSVLLTLVLLYPGFLVLGDRGGVVCDPDAYWQMATGAWVVEHGQVPRTDPFARHAEPEPWVAYSWLFGLLLYGLHQAFGIAGLVVYTMAMYVLITAALFHLLVRLQPSMLVALAAAVIGVIGMRVIATPRPWLFSILFYILEVDVLLTVGRTGKLRYLWFLPPLFLIWANIHIEFIFGGVVLALAIVESAVQRFAVRSDPEKSETGSWLPRFLDVGEAVPLVPLVLISIACGLAALVNPYHVRVYLTAFDLLRQEGLRNHIAEALAMSFRRPADWAVLWTTMAAVFCIGWRRHVRLFLLLLFCLGQFWSFKSVRNVWVVLVVDLVIISLALREPLAAPFLRLGKARLAGIAAAVALILGLAGSLELSNARLEEAVAGEFPEEACAWVLEHHCLGPLFNHFNWGGYLIWRLRSADPPLPVSVDGRTVLYREDQILKQTEAWNGGRTWEEDPNLAAANLVIGKPDMALISLLRTGKRFRLAYEDKTAAVFVRQPGPD